MEWTSFKCPCGTCAETEFDLPFGWEVFFGEARCPTCIAGAIRRAGSRAALDEEERVSREGDAFLQELRQVRKRYGW